MRLDFWLFFSGWLIRTLAFAFASIGSNSDTLRPFDGREACPINQIDSAMIANRNGFRRFRTAASTQQKSDLARSVFSPEASVRHILCALQQFPELCLDHQCVKRHVSLLQTVNILVWTILCATRVFIYSCKAHLWIFFLRTALPDPPNLRRYVHATRSPDAKSSLGIDRSLWSAI